MQVAVYLFYILLGEKVALFDLQHDRIFDKKIKKILADFVVIICYPIGNLLSEMQPLFRECMRHCFLVITFLISISKLSKDLKKSANNPVTQLWIY